MAHPTEYETALGRYIRSKLGSETKVILHSDKPERSSIYIVSGINYPIQGVTSYGSVGLSRVEQYSGRTPVWVELLGVCASNVKDFDNLIASCAFFSINDKYNLTYGTFVEKILDEYRMSRTLHHVTFIHPFIWDEFGNGFTRATVAGKDIHWLMVLPISDMELKYLKKQGIDALENLFAEKQIDVYDINRPSAI